jgi:small conductance mechanosensitive channel
VHGYLYQLLRKAGLSPFGASTGEFLLLRPLTILLILLAAWVVGRIAARAVRRFVRGVHAGTPLGRTSLRAEQRAATVGDVLASMVRIVVWAVAGLMALDEVGLDLAPLLAGAGIAGLAIGFGAQTLVKDFISGLFILLEDQFGVGDQVTLGDATGTVEDVSLRVTRLRSVDGTVWFVPNGELRKVGNASMEWSRAVVDVMVAYESDLREVTGLLEEAAGSLLQDPAWNDDVLEPPEVWGVHSMGADGLTLRVVAKTAPLRQAAVGRELRGRISGRLRGAGVKMPGGGPRSPQL